MHEGRARVLRPSYGTSVTTPPLNTAFQSVPMRMRAYFVMQPRYDVIVHLGVIHQLLLDTRIVVRSDDFA